ncbi:hypothetical protein PsYK624_091240 [Phanerochaete sordida]|uniref:Uncharacterized protein n=1 Tax=Phanerochaete sordida TaxID=48140 RepID=A0A9P3LF55_9APHY|nr:hypothetical protein PsYK624_091240 [Phanerochaete sordida]
MVRTAPSGEEMALTGSQIAVPRAMPLEQPHSLAQQLAQQPERDQHHAEQNATSTPPAPPFDAYHTFLDVPYPTPGIVVPQAAHANTPRASSAHVVPLAPPLRLTRDRAALRAQLAALAGAERVVPVSASGEFSVVIKWPGYAEWRRTTPLAGAGHVQPVWRLAVLVVAAVEAFVREMKDAASSEARPDWWVAGIDVERLVLLEVRRTGAGTWQPVLCLMVE